MSLDVSDYAAILAVIISVGSAIVSIRLTRKELSDSTFHRVIENFARIDERILENPDLRPYIYGLSPKDLEPELRQRLDALCELILDVFEWVSHDIPTAPPVDRDPWTDYIQQVVTESPALREQHENWRTLRPLLDEIIQARLEARPVKF